MIFRRGVRHELLVANAPREGEPSLHFRFAFLFPLRPIRWEGEGQGEVGQFPASPSRHLCSCLAPSIGTVSPAHSTDSPALQPLHSLPRSASQITRCAFAHSDGRKLSRQSGHKSCAPEMQNGRETSSDQQAIACDASHGPVGAGSACQYGARLRPARWVQAPPANNREHGHFPTATLRWRSISPLGQMPDLTDKTNLV